MKKLIALICLLVALTTTAAAAPLQLLSPPTGQLDASTKTTVKQLLDAKWNREPTNKLESKSIFSDGPKNPEVVLAYALNRIHHNSIDQALEVANESRVRFKQNWDGRILEIWLLTLTNKYDSALVQMRSFKKQLDTANKKAQLPAKVSQDLYGRFGRLIGYLEGPVAEKVNPQLLASTTVLLEQNIDPETKKAFTLARQSVKAQYEQLLAEQVAYQNKELTKVAASNEVEKERLVQDNQLTQQTRARLEPEIEELSSESNLQTTRLQQQIYSAGNSLHAINQSAYGLEQQLGYLYLDLYSLGPRNLHGAYTIQNHIYRLENELNQQRIAATNQAGVLNGLQNDLFAVRRNFQQRIGQAKHNLRRVEGAQKRNFKQLKKIAAGPKIAGGKTQSLASRRTALRTYDNLPLELYRQEMLDSIR